MSQWNRNRAYVVVTMPIGFEAQRNLRALQAAAIGGCLSVTFAGLFLLTAVAIRALGRGPGTQSGEVASWLSLVWALPALALVAPAWSKTGLPVCWGCFGFIAGYAFIAVFAVVLAITTGV
jgi:hypothetical protein